MLVVIGYAVFGPKKQAMIILQEMAVFNTLYGSLAAMLVFKIT